MALNILAIKPTPAKKSKTYYLDKDDIALVKKEAKRHKVSQNAFLSALIDDHRRQLQSETEED